MKVRDALERIRFGTATTNDLSGKSANTLFNNRNIVTQLKFALDRYAQYTLAIEDIFSFPFKTSVRVVSTPPDIIRSKGYRYAIIWIDGRKYSMDIKDWNRTQSEYPYDTYADIPRWMVPWDTGSGAQRKKELYIYPKNINTFSTTNLSQAVKANDTVINVASTNAFPPNIGRMTIGDEKVRYLEKTDTQFTGCTRGLEGTTPSDHDIGTEVLENNFNIYYYKKHFEIPVDANNRISEEVGNTEMEVDDVHMEIITDYTIFKLLIKVDTERADKYKVNFDEWLKEVQGDILEGRNSITKGSMIREPYDWENVYAYDVY